MKTVIQKETNYSEPNRKRSRRRKKINSTFANKGMRVSPMFITQIEDKNGKNTHIIPGHYLLFVGFMFLGIAIGKLLGSVSIGTLVGMGLGFVAWGITSSIAKKNDK